MADPDDDDRLRIPSTKGVARTDAASATAAADGIEGATKAAALAAVDAARAAGALRGTAAIVEALAAGTIDIEQARAALIADAVGAHLPADADPQVISRIRADVEAMLADDPVIAELLRR